MTKYLLLRDNKQTGPYDLGELRTKGLKAYDLVWIDGKSAAWRYPSEVEELKSFAPAVEEQPFDRFYKKPAQETHPSLLQARQAIEQAAMLQAKKFTEQISLLQAKQAAEQASLFQSRQPAEQDQAADIPIVSQGVNTTADNTSVGEPSAVPGKRIIYVTMPSGKGTAPAKEPPARPQVSGSLIAVQDMDRPRFQDLANTSSQESQLSSLYVQTQAPSKTAIQPQVADTPAQSVPSVYPASMPSEEKFSHSSDGMWKTAVEMTPRPKKPGLKRLIQPIGVLLCILALLAAGIFIGLSINKDSFGFSTKFAAKDGSQASVPPVQHTDPPTVSHMPVYNTSAKVDQSAADTVFRTGARAGSSLSDNPAGSQPVNANSAAPAVTSKKRPPAQKDKATPSTQKESVGILPRDSAASSFQAMHREAVHRPDPAVDKDVIKNNIANLVSAGSGKYNVGTFGGISDLQITVSNRSIYPLDLVVVEVRYIQANKKVFKTENLYFRDIGAGAAIMQEAPKSSRGVKIDYKITLINSKELGLSYSGI